MYHAHVRALALGCLALVACGDDGPRLHLAPVHSPACGAVAGARTLLVTPLGDFVGERLSVPLDGPFTLPTLPADTRGLAVEVLGAGGEQLAIGRTAPLALGELADGAAIPIAMAPPDGLCPAGALTTARDRATAVVVGDGVLVVGGAAEASAERFDPDTETTTPLALPPAFTGGAGVVGAGVVALPDGRAVVIGGLRPGFTIYTPGEGFGAATLLAETRAHHVTIALDARRVLVAAGCGVVDDTGACEGDNVRRDSRIVDLTTGVVTAGPALAIARRDGVGALELDGAGRATALLTGGTDEHGDPVAIGERLALDGGAPQPLPGTGARLARLDGGAVLTAFAPPGAPAAAAAAVVVPAGPAPRPTGAVATRSGPALVTQDDGAVIALGGGAPLRYQPSQGGWQALPDPGVALGGAPAAVRWRDGSVLVFGGRDGGGAPTAAVWRFRPRLLGPLTGAVTVVPGDATSAPALTPLDPADVDRADGWRLGGRSWAVVGGPTAGDARLDIVLTVPPTGVAVLTGFVDAAEHDDVVLVPGQVATVERVRAGQLATVCRGGVVPAAGATAIQLVLTRASVRAVVGGVAVLSCALDDRRRGQLGVAARGAPVAIGSIAVSR